MERKDHDEIVLESNISHNLPFVFVLELHASFQFFTRDLTRWTKIESATDGLEEDFTTLVLGVRVGQPIRTFAIDSWALDRYDMPETIKRKKTIIFPKVKQQNSQKANI